MTLLQSLLGLHAELQFELGLRLVFSLTVVTGSALLLQKLAGSDAAMRHRLLSLSLLLVLGIPLVVGTVPVVPLTYDLPAGLASIDNPPRMGQWRAALAERLGAAQAFTVTDTGSPRSGPGPLAWLALAWFAGAALSLGRLVIAMRRVRDRALRSASGPPPWVLAIGDRAMLDLDMRRPVRIVMSSAFDVPVTFGERRPVMLIPADAVHWNAATVESAIRHELAHVRRRDWTWQIVGATACSLFWFHPLVWRAAGLQRYSAELAADAAVVASGLRPSAYARALVEVATMPSRPAGLAPVAVALAPATTLERRIAELDRHKHGLAHGWRVGLTVLFLALTVAASGIAGPVMAGGCHAQALEVRAGAT